MMTETRTCPKCGSPLPENAPAGICPTCLMQAGLASDPEVGSSPEMKPTLASGFVPPEPEELAKHFPQLEILELIGKGGMGAVYKACQRGLDRLVAVKVLPPEISRDPSFAERFTREARALARLSHNHIVSVYDFGQADGLFFIVMEFVDGINLRQTIQSGGLSPADALTIVPQICEALQFAHDEGIVHRDIKPENILIDKKGRVKIADFGLAKLVGQDASDHSLTATHQVMGTLRYMAPEQMQGSREVDHRADIYSLGVVFYELLTGELPMGKFAPPSRRVQVDVRLDEIVLRALEQEPEQRYQHASEVKTDVDAISRSPSVARPVSAKGLVMPTISPQIRRQLKGPAISLMLYGLLILFPAVLCFTNGFDIADGNDATPATTGFVMIALSFLLLGLSGLLVRGGWHMLAVESYRAAFLGSFLGQPIGMWGLFVLSRPDVKSAFPTVSREKTGTASRSQPDRPPLVLVWATLDLVASVGLMLAVTAGDHVLVSASESWLWHAWGISEVVLGGLGAVGLFVASIALFLWTPWARKLVLGVCFFGLAALVIDLPYLAQKVIPAAFEMMRQDALAQGHPADRADSVATLGLLIGFGGLFVVSLTWLIGHFVYFTRPRVIAAFESQRE